MAKAKATTNLSQAIRNFFTDYPKAKAKEVVAALAAKGVAVKEGLVYAVRGSMNEKSRRKKRVARAAMAAVQPGNNGHGSKADAITLVRAVKDLAVKAGGFEKLKELVDALAE